MRDALFVFPPLSDFTAPPPDLASAKAAATAVGVETTTVDLNLRAFAYLMTPAVLAERTAAAEARVSALSKRQTLGFWEQQELLALTSALTDGVAAHAQAGFALDVLRDREQFFRREAYTQAVDAVTRALRLASALAFPFVLRPAVTSAPFSIFSEEALARYIAVDPFRPVYDKLVGDAGHASVVAIVMAEASQFLSGLSLARTLRAAKPEIFLVACGPWLADFASAQSGGDEGRALALLHGFFDAVVTEDDDALAADVIAAAKTKSLRAGPGVSFAPSHRPTGKRAPLPQSEPAVPDYADLGVGDYFSPEPVLSLRPTRGRYLSRVSGHYWSAGRAAPSRLAPERAAEVVRELHTKHGVRAFRLVGDALPFSWLRAFGEALGGHEQRWSAELELEDVVQPEDATALHATGCVALTLGLNENARHPAATLGRSAEALAHARIAVTLACTLDFPGMDEARARDASALLKSHAHEIDLAFVSEREPGLRVSADPVPLGIASQPLVGEATALYPDFSRALSGNARERELTELLRASQSCATQSFPWIGSATSAHTLLVFDRFGRRAFAAGGPRTGAQNGGRALADGDRVRVAETAKMLWMPYQLSVLEEIGREEHELRMQDLRRRGREVGADRVWAYSHRDDLKMRAQQRTPHMLSPGMTATEISVLLADALGLIGDQFLPVSQIVARAPRELREALRRQLVELYAHGALITEARPRSGHPQQAQGQPQQRGEAAQTDGQSPGGRRRRRRRRGRGGRGPDANRPGGPPQ